MDLLFVPEISGSFAPLSVIPVKNLDVLDFDSHSL